MNTYALICTHNGSKFINEQINSILNQTESIDFIYVCDFNSTDGTQEVILRICESNPKVFSRFYTYAVSAKNSFFEAFKYILSIACNEDYIFISDQDDVWALNKVETLKPFILKNVDESLLLLFHDVLIADSNLEVIANSFYIGSQFLIPRDLTIDRLMMSNCIVGHTMVVSGSLLRLVVKNINEDKYIMHDWAITLYASAFAKIIFVPLKLSYYRQHESNLIGAHGEKNLKRIISKTYTFPDSVIKQAVSFQQEINKLTIDPSLSLILLSHGSNSFIFKILNFPFDSLKFIPLSFFAFLRGGTLRKKAIGMLVLSAGLLNLLKKIWH